MSGKIDPLLLVERMIGIASRQGKQMLGFEKDERRRFRFEIRLFRFDHQKCYVGFVTIGKAFGYKTGHILRMAYKYSAFEFPRHNLQVFLYLPDDAFLPLCCRRLLRLIGLLPDLRSHRQHHVPIHAKFISIYCLL